MNEIIVRSQKEWNALPEKFEQETLIKIVESTEWIYLNVARENSRVVAWENSNVEAWGNSRVVARENSRVIARENSRVVAWENSNVVAWGNSRVEAWENSRVVARENSRVVAWENSNVVAWGNSRVEAWKNSRVVAWENSNVEAWENSRVEARENSRVVARGNSRVEARGNSRVVAWENSRVEARGNSRVVAWENSNVVAWENSNVEAWGFSVAFCQSDSCKIIKGKYAHIQKPFTAKDLTDWIEIWGAKKQGKKLVLYKRVSKDFKTQEGQSWETDWSIGNTLEFKTWEPGESECGSGKFHACATPGLCDQFRNEKADDKYIAILVDKKDCFVWKDSPDYPSKISVRKAKVLYECDRFGDKINELKGGEMKPKLTHKQLDAICEKCTEERP